MAKDYTSLVKTAKGLLDKFGTAMQVIQNTHGAYNGTNDTYSSTVVTYDTIGVITNPELSSTRKSTLASAGEYSKADRVRVLLNGLDLPILDNIDFKVIYGTMIWFPDKILTVRPGGVAVLYLIDMK